MLYKESNFHKETNYFVKTEAKLHFIYSCTMKNLLIQIAENSSSNRREQNEKNKWNKLTVFTKAAN